jgi:hypothetical protein
MSNTTRVRRVSSPVLLVITTTALGLGSRIALASKNESTTMPSEQAPSRDQQGTVATAAATELEDISQAPNGERRS